MGQPEYCRKRVVVHGVVQGVYYRQSMLQQAQVLGVAGWCRNTPEGTVEAEVIGSSGAVESLLAWCHKGPPHARVSRVDTEEMPPQAEQPVPMIFEIRR